MWEEEERPDPWRKMFGQEAFARDDWRRGCERAMLWRRALQTSVDDSIVSKLDETHVMTA